MGYRRLIKHYLQHVYNRTGDTWISAKSRDNLSDRDVNELHSIWLDIERGLETDAEDNLNQCASSLCEQHNLTIDELAGRLGWQRRIIEEWFLPAQHPRHRQMTRRDFEHFESSIDSIITRQGDRP